MYRLPYGVHVPPFRGAVLGLEVQCLEMQGLRLRDHTMVMPGMVQVINMTLDLAAVTFSPTALADHISPHMVSAFLTWAMV